MSTTRMPLIVWLALAAACGSGRATEPPSPSSTSPRIHPEAEPAAAPRAGAPTPPVPASPDAPRDPRPAPSTAPTFDTVGAETCRVGTRTLLGTSDRRRTDVEVAFAGDQGLVVWSSAWDALTARPVAASGAAMGPAVELALPHGGRLATLASLGERFVAIVSAVDCTERGADCIVALTLAADGRSLGPAHVRADRDVQCDTNPASSRSGELVVARTCRWTYDLLRLTGAADGSIAIDALEGTNVDSGLEGTSVSSLGPSSLPYRAITHGAAGVVALAEVTYGENLRGLRLYDERRAALGAVARGFGSLERPLDVLAFDAVGEEVWLVHGGRVTRFGPDGAALGRVGTRVARASLPLPLRDRVFAHSDVIGGETTLVRTDALGGPVGEPPVFARAPRGRPAGHDVAFVGTHFVGVAAEPTGEVHEVVSLPIDCRP